MRLAVLALLAGAASGQDNGTISGIAVNAATGAPIPGARLELVSYGTAYSVPGAIAGADGTFEIRQVPPGKYRLTGAHTGFLRTTYGSHTANGEGKLLTVQPKAELSGVRMEILPLGWVAGRVVDAEGNPVRGVPMILALVQWTTGTRQYLLTGSATTGEQGEYRIRSVQPGRYLLLARRRDEATTFYPGGADVRAAQEFEVGAGQSLDAMNLKVASAKCVAVKVKIPGLEPPASVSLVPRNASGDLVWPAAAGSGLRNGDELTFPAVAPGEYLLTASVGPEGAIRYARREVTIGERAPEEIVLRVEDAATVQGTVRIEKGKLRPGSRMRVILLARDQGAAIGAAPAGTVAEDGSFEAKQVAPGHYAVYVSGMGQGVYLQSVSEQGRELLAEGLDVAGPAAHTLSLVLSEHPGGLLGTVETEGESIVLVYPTDPMLRRLPYYHRRLRTDAHGGFAIQDLAPGEYEVVAVDEIEPGANLNESVMRGVVGRGKVVTVREDSAPSVTLKRVMLSAR